MKNQRKTAFVHRCVKRVQKPFLSHKNKKIPGKKPGKVDFIGFAKCRKKSQIAINVEISSI